MNVHFEQVLDAIAVDSNGPDLWPKEMMNHYIVQFVDAAKQLECSLIEIQNHSRLNTPEGLEKEVASLEAELARKNLLISRYKAKISEWETIWRELENNFHEV